MDNVTSWASRRWAAPWTASFECTFPREWYWSARAVSSKEPGAPRAYRRTTKQTRPCCCQSATAQLPSTAANGSSCSSLRSAPRSTAHRTSSRYIRERPRTTGCFPRRVHGVPPGTVEGLRQPLEDGRVVVTRIVGSSTSSMPPVGGGLGEPAVADERRPRRRRGVPRLSGSKNGSKAATTRGAHRKVAGKLVGRAGLEPATDGL